MSREMLTGAGDLKETDIGVQSNHFPRPNHQNTVDFHGFLSVYWLEGLLENVDCKILQVTTRSEPMFSL